MSFSSFATLIYIILLLISALFTLRTKRIDRSIFILFVFISLYYLYGFLPVLYQDGEKLPALFSSIRESSIPQIKALGLTFLIYFFSVKIFTNRYTILSRLTIFIKAYKRYLYLILAWFLSSAFILTFNDLSFLATKTLLQQGLILSFSFCFYLLFTTEKIENLHTKKELTFLTLIILLIASYEFITSKTWVSGSVVRASSTLLNPNNLGLWCFFVGGYLFTTKNKHSHKLIYINISLIAYGLFVSSSRSIAFIFIGFIISLGLLKALRGQSLKIYSQKAYSFFLPFSFLCIFPHFLGRDLSQIMVIRNLQVSSGRFLFTVPQALNHFFNIGPNRLSESWFVNKFIITHDSLTGGGNIVDAGKINIASRVTKLSSDNSFIFLFRETSLLHFLIWITIILIPLCLTITRRGHKSLESSHIFFIFFLICGFTINIFNTFPGWIFLASFLGFFKSLIYKDNQEY